MCGIVGYFSSSQIYNESVIKNMTSSITHRGPDDFGVKEFREEKFQLSLGHRRLSILDVKLSKFQYYVY